MPSSTTHAPRDSYESHSEVPSKEPKVVAPTQAVPPEVATNPKALEEVSQAAPSGPGNESTILTGKKLAVVFVAM